MREDPSLWRHIDNSRFIPFGNRFKDIGIAIVDRLAGHDHTNTAAVRSIVGFSMLIQGKVTDIVTIYFQFPNFPYMLVGAVVSACGIALGTFWNKRK